MTIRSLSAGSVDDDGWRRAQALAATVEDHELLDPTLSPERLLYRLFHEEEVRAFQATPLDAQCNCTRERVETMLNQFSAARAGWHGRRRRHHRDV